MGGLDFTSPGLLRSSAAADGGRCLETFAVSTDRDKVAILGRRGRRPLLLSTLSRAAPSACCDPRPPRTAAAASAEARASGTTALLRSSAAADGGRCFAVRPSSLST